jgi:hypothetical protein
LVHTEGQKGEGSISLLVSRLIPSGRTFVTDAGNGALIHQDHGGHLRSLNPQR